MLKKGGQIVENLNKSEKENLELSNKFLLDNNMEYFVFSHKLLSKEKFKDISKDMTFGYFDKRLNDLKTLKFIDENSFNIMKLKTEFFIKFLSHGVYVKDLGSINDEHWVCMTAVTTSKKSISFEGKNVFKTTKIEGLDNKDLYIGCSVILKVKKFNELSNYVTKDRRIFYDEDERVLIAKEIDKLNEGGYIPLVNFEEYKNSVKNLFLIESLNLLGIDENELKQKKQEYGDNLENERNKPIVYTKEMKDKITFFKSFNAKFESSIDTVENEQILSDKIEL